MQVASERLNGKPLLGMGIGSQLEAVPVHMFVCYCFLLVVVAAAFWVLLCNVVVVLLFGGLLWCCWCCGVLLWIVGCRFLPSF